MRETPTADQLLAPAMRPIFGDSMKSIVTIICLALLVGCRSSDRSIRLAEGDLRIERATPLPHGTIPIAATRRGDRIALLSEGPTKGEQSISVIDTDTLRELGRVDVPETSNSTPMFTRAGSELCLVLEEGLVAWNYQTGSRRKLDGTPAEVPLEKILSGGGWNVDRSIAIASPRMESKRVGKKDVEVPVAGQVAVEGRKVCEVMWGSEAGFDSYGNAWSGAGGVWMKVDRNGKVETNATAPKGLTPDQSRDRGSMHLRDTQREMNYQGSSAYVTCVWLTHDRSVAPERGPNHRAALVYAGADVIAYGFVPGRELVYVVTQEGSFLVKWVHEKRAP